MANEINWEYIFPAVKIPLKSNCEYQIEAIMDRALKTRPKQPDVGLKPAA